MYRTAQRSLTVLSRTVVGCRELRVSSSLRSHNCFKIQDPKDFEERVMKSTKPVIIDFFATWCSPCRTLAPRIESIINENDGKVVLAKVDIDENTDIALDFDVSSVPVLIAMENGKIVDRIIGLQDSDKLRKFVGKVVKD